MISDHFLAFLLRGHEKINSQAAPALALLLSSISTQNSPKVLPQLALQASRVATFQEATRRASLLLLSLLGCSPLGTPWITTVSWQRFLAFLLCSCRSLVHLSTLVVLPGSRLSADVKFRAPQEPRPLEEVVGSVESFFDVIDCTRNQLFYLLIAPCWFLSQAAQPRNQILVRRILALRVF